MSVLLWLLLLASIVLVIWLLHGNQRRRTHETAELNAPLPSLELPSTPPPVTTEPVDAGAGPDSWMGQVRALRDNGQLGTALDLCRNHYPRSQAFQQAAVIQRQQIREAVEQLQPAAQLLRELYRTAVMADLFRSSNPHKPADSGFALEQLRHAELSYAAIGHQHLKLLNKSDAKALEQLWGSPAGHKHAEDALPELWLAACRKNPQ